MERTKIQFSENGCYVYASRLFIKNVTNMWIRYKTERRRRNKLENNEPNIQYML